MASLGVLAACLLVLSQLSRTEIGEGLDLSLRACTAFYASLLLIQLLSFCLWRLYASGYGMVRSVPEALIDTGLLALGKYVPGKVWGMMARGAVDGAEIRIDRRRVFVSVSEQALLLCIGTLVLGVLVIASRWSMSTGMTAAVAVLLVLSVSAALVLARRRVHWLRVEGVPIRSLVGACLLLVVGYATLWIASTLPIIVLVHHGDGIALSQVPELMSAFLGAMIAGGLALFVPGGIGIRESTFAVFAPAFMSWEQGLFWITVHRGLSVIFDLLFGLVCLAAVARRQGGAVTA